MDKLAERAQAVDKRDAMSIERFTTWAFSAQLADRIVQAREAETDQPLAGDPHGHSGCGCYHAMRIGQLGVMVDTSGPGATFAAQHVHPDAELCYLLLREHVHADEVASVVKYARLGSRPEHSPFPATGLEPAQIVDDRSTSRGWRGRVRTWKGKPYCPLVVADWTRDLDAQRWIYFTWARAMNTLRDVLREHDAALQSYTIVGEPMPLEPWRDPSVQQWTSVGAVDRQSPLLVDGQL